MKNPKEILKKLSQEEPSKLEKAKEFTGNRKENWSKGSKNQKLINAFFNIIDCKRHNRIAANRN